MHCLLIVGAYGTLGRLDSSILDPVFVFFVLFVLREGENDLYQVFFSVWNQLRYSTGIPNALTA